MLDAALDLLDQPRNETPTTEQIAERAELSVATVYNLVGTREQLLLALVDRLVAQAAGSAGERAGERDPVAALQARLTDTVALLTSRSTAHRRVVLQLTAAATPELHTALSPGSLFAEAVRRAQEAKVLRTDLDPEALGLQLYLSFNGALLRWAAGALSDARFEAAVLHGVAVVLAAAATPRHRAALVDDLAALGETLVGRD